MARLIKMKLRMIRGLALKLVFILICGCATPPPPYVAEPKVLHPVQFFSQHPPTVRVRPATAEETEKIMQFPKKSVPRAVAEDVTVFAFGSPLLFLFGPGMILDGLISDNNAKSQDKDVIRKVLE
jgi:hypothetical protein